MTPAKIWRFRERLRRVLKKSFPQIDQIEIGAAMKLLERLMVNEAFNLVMAEHGRDCACWYCILQLNGEIVRWQAERRIIRENDYD
jgi:hypothetical protein